MNELYVFYFDTESENKIFTKTQDCTSLPILLTVSILRHRQYKMIQHMQDISPSLSWQIVIKTTYALLKKNDLCPSQQKRHALLKKNDMPFSRKTTCPSQEKRQALLKKNDMPFSRKNDMPFSRKTTCASQEFT